MSLFIPITKVDAAKRLVYGTLTEEVPDKAGEIIDYATARPAFETWSRQFESASGGKSLGNVRAMHGGIAVGKFTDIHFDDENKRICGVAKIVDDDEWQKVLEGVYTGFSIGGGYARRWQDRENPELMRYTPVLHEVSLVDNPAVPTATFDVVKMDGSVECRKFNLIRKDAPMNDITNDDNATHCEALQQELNWLAQYVKGTDEEDTLQPHIDALQQFLADGPCDDAQAPVEKMVKMADFQKSMFSLIEELQKRLSRIESQPMPGRGSARAFGKSADYAKQEEELAKMTPEARAHELMKIALSNPILL